MLQHHKLYSQEKGDEIFYGRARERLVALSEILVLAKIQALKRLHIKG